MKRVILLLFIGILSFILGVWTKTIWKSKETQISATSNEKDSVEGAVISKSSSNTKSLSRIDTILNEPDELIIQKSGDLAEVKRKYNPKKTFKDFTVTEKFKGTTPKLNFSTCKYGKEFITMTKNWLPYGANFAGHYVFASWRDGSNYFMSSIIDLKTGNVYAGPEGNQPFEYKLDSKLILANPPDSAGWYSPTDMFSGQPTEYVWTGTNYKQLE